MTAATAATIAAPFQVTLSENHRVAFVIIVARLGERSTQQIEINLLERIRWAMPGNFIRMK